MVLVAAALAVVLVSCGSGDPGRHTKRTGVPCRIDPAAGPQPHDAAGLLRTIVPLVDRSRPTPAIPGRPASSCRVLRTEIRAADGDGNPRPMLVVAHGLDGRPAALGPLLDHWARAGYVVVAPTFPTTKKDANGDSLRSESVAQAADMRFVVSEVLARDRDPSRRPWGPIDRSRIGAAGMSLGGLAVYGLIANTCCRDPRVRAGLLLAAVRREFPDDDYVRNRVPVMLVQGDSDPGYHNSDDAYPDLAPPKWFVTLVGSRHSPPFEVPNGPEAPAVRQLTTAFWDCALRHDAAAADRIDTVVRASGGRITERQAPPHPAC
ncbi:MAG: alpha/beta hydrolase family protein [Acidimicrobiia bacterium]